MLSKIEKFMRTYIRDFIEAYPDDDEDHKGYWCAWYFGKIASLESVKKIYTLYVSDDENVRETIIPETVDEYIYFAIYYMIDKNNYFATNNMLFQDRCSIFTKIIEYLEKAIILGSEDAKYILARFRYFLSSSAEDGSNSITSITKEEYIDILIKGAKIEQNMYAMYFLGVETEITDKERTMKYYNKAMIRGCSYALYAYALINIYKYTDNTSIGYMIIASKNGIIGAWLSLAHIYRNEHAKAEYYLLKGVKHRNPEAMVELGELYKKTKRYEEGIQILQLAIEKGKTFGNEVLGIIYYKLGDYKKAKHYLNIAINSKRYCAASYYIGKCYKKEGKYEKMIKQYMKVYLYDDTPWCDVCPNILQEIIDYYVGIGDLEKAISVTVKGDTSHHVISEENHKTVKSFLNDESKYDLIIKYMVIYGMYDLFDDINDLAKYFVTTYPIHQLQQILKSQKERGKVLRNEENQIPIVKLLWEIC